ncbi:conserved hypothetical protein [Arcobacter nitrofigilis DSM 7299]|uniref:Uncharacterized protein n=1 Tax=Arcobacter nitrofigilis (strain ATCC 33309 / DSM 7299 / CCUG 15893 / LMG 7604 / NCTC 12251 / CI) TaxID=572480 RepID=D5V1F9_ARCNC|nr:hypothetical protein [Arcobacter nitrofigilis]ADG93393.1 conserved hypothetical protein [Arcobacter nitrofigilis DSM 7299]
MTLLLNKLSLYSTFGVDDFESLDKVINNMAPSMVEYYLSDLSDGFENVYLNKRNIQNSLTIGDFAIYLDYSDEIYLEIDDNKEDLETSSLW